MSLYSTITVTACNRKTITYTHYLPVAHLSKLLTDFEVRLHAEFDRYYPRTPTGRLPRGQHTAVIAEFALQYFFRRGILSGVGGGYLQGILSWIHTIAYAISSCSLAGGFWTLSMRSGLVWSGLLPSLSVQTSRLPRCAFSLSAAAYS